MKLRTACWRRPARPRSFRRSTFVSAQDNPRAPRESAQVRHLVYIATPGDNGTDNQSGIVVLDADKDYSFLKRISYELAGEQDARSQDIGHHGQPATPDALCDQ